MRCQGSLEVMDVAPPSPGPSVWPLPLQGPLCVSDVVQLLPLVYSLWGDAAPPDATASSGPFSAQEEQELQHTGVQVCRAFLLISVVL